ncbi:MAG: GntR family transcriptional regulator, partial [Kiritimatiellia bacterium]
MKTATARKNSYQTMAGRLRQRIVSGAIRPGARLPTERTLAERHGVARVTVRRALRVLEAEQLVLRIQGSGTYARAVPARRIPLAIDYGGSMRHHAPRLVRT